MLIHFVCSGNTYRSRIAEAYLNSKKLPGIQATSSGINADKNINGPVVWVTAWLLKQKDLISFLKPNWTQTTNELIQNADLIIFMHKSIYTSAKEQFNTRNKEIQIWEVSDLDKTVENFDGDEKAFILYDIDFTEKTYAIIQTKIDDLINSIER